MLKNNYFSHEKKFKILIFQRFIVENIFIFLLQYSGLMLSLLSFKNAPIWFASGTASAFVFLRGYRILGSLWLGSLCAFYFAGSGVGRALLAASLIISQTCLLVFLTRRFIKPTVIFYQKKTLIHFLLLSVLITGFFAFLLEYSCFRSINYHWWLPNFNGILIFTFAILSLDAFFPDLERLSQINYFKYGLLLTFFIFSFFCFSGNIIYLIPIHGFILFFIAKEFGWCGIVFSIFISSLIFSLTGNKIMAAAYISLISIIGLYFATQHNASRLCRC